MVGSLPKCFDKEYFDVQRDDSKVSVHQGRVERSRLTYVTHFYMDLSGESRYVGSTGICITMESPIILLTMRAYFNGPKPYGDWLYGPGEVFFLL